MISTELVSVVVPFFNEEENVSILAERIEEALSGLPGYDYECIFVNDGSTDGTREQLESVCDGNARMHALHLVRNFGQSAALVAGMTRARGQFVLTLDGDLQNDPADLPKILDLLELYDCVCGYRAIRNDTWPRRLSSRIANRVRNWILHDGIRDTGCGTKGFRRRCIKHILPFNGVHRFFAAMMRNAGLSIAECPVSHHPRIFGKSKYGLHNRLWRGLYDLVGVSWLSGRYMCPVVEGETELGHGPYE